MTIHDLYALQNLRTTIAILMKQLDVLRRYGDANAGTEKVLIDALEQLFVLEPVEEGKLRALAESIDDPVIREIIRMRFLEGKAWVDIAVEVVPLEKDSTHTAPIKRIERFLKNF